MQMTSVRHLSYGGTAMNEVGMAHRVTMVKPQEGLYVVVDWGNGQFSYLAPLHQTFLEKRMNRPGKTIGFL